MVSYVEEVSIFGVLLKNRQNLWTEERCDCPKWTRQMYEQKEEARNAHLGGDCLVRRIDRGDMLSGAGTARDRRNIEREQSY